MRHGARRARPAPGSPPPSPDCDTAPHAGATANPRRPFKPAAPTLSRSRPNPPASKGRREPPAHILPGTPIHPQGHRRGLTRPLRTRAHDPRTARAGAHTDGEDDDHLERRRTQRGPTLLTTRSHPASRRADASVDSKKAQAEQRVLLNLSVATWRLRGQPDAPQKCARGRWRTRAMLRWGPCGRVGHGASARRRQRCMSDSTRCGVARLCDIPDDTRASRLRGSRCHPRVPGPTAVAHDGRPPR